jgi:leucyl aminopeptidase (aminopeptidase T)
MTAHQRTVSASIDPVKLDRLAEVAIKVGLRLQPGQDLLLTAPAVALPLVRRIAEHAYKAGAGLVTPFFSDEEVTLARYRFGHNESFDGAANWLYEGMAKAFGANTARLAIVGDNPMLLSGEDPAKVARASKANSIAYQPALEKIVNFETNWNSSPIRARHGQSRSSPMCQRMLRWRDSPTRFLPPRASIRMAPSPPGGNTMPCCASGPNGSTASASTRCIIPAPA